MRRYRPWIALAVVSLLFFIVLLAPAGLLVGGLQQQLPGLKVSSVSGTVWRGEAYGLSWGSPRRGIALTTLKWRARAWSLLALSPAADIEGQLEEQQYSARLSLPLGHDLRLENLRAELPLAALAVNSPVPLSGRVSAEVARLTIDDDRIAELSGRVVLHDLVIEGQQRPLPLGSFAAELDQRDGELVAKLFDLGGPGKLEGELRLGLDGEYRTDSVIALASDSDESLRNWLPLLGEPTADDRYRLVQRGRFW